MLKENRFWSVQSPIYRQDVRPLTDKQVALVENFAAQGVIAIRTRAFSNEFRERTEERCKLNQHSNSASPPK